MASAARAWAAAAGSRRRRDADNAGGAGGAPPAPPPPRRHASVIDVQPLADERAVVHPDCDPHRLADTAVAGRIRRHRGVPVDGEVADETHRAVQDPAVPRGGVRVLLLDVEAALRCVAGGPGGHRDEAVDEAVLDHHEDLTALVDLEVGGRPRVTRLDRLGAVELAPVVAVERVGARQAIRLLERHHGVGALRVEGRADVRHADIEARERREETAHAEPGRTDGDPRHLGPYGRLEACLLYTSDAAAE